MVVARMGRDDDAVLSSYATILELLLRMRQVCSHPGLVPKDVPSMQEWGGKKVRVG